MCGTDIAGGGLSRRTFLRGGLAMGGLVAAASLPAVADEPSTFPGQHKRGRISLGLHHIEAGASKPFSVLHISDTHLTAAYPHEDEKKQALKKARTNGFGGRQEDALRNSLAFARKNVDYVLHTGDLIDWQSEANFDLVRKYYGEGGAAMFGALGNHEFSRYMWMEKTPPGQAAAYRKKSCELLSAAFPFDISLASSVVNGVNFVSMDDTAGTVTPEQVERFGAEVKKGLPIILCMHVPLYTPYIWRASCKFWAKDGARFRSADVPDATGDYRVQLRDKVTQAFIASLKAEPLLKGILVGHLHFDVQDRFSPTAMEYVVGGNYLFHGQELLIS